MLLFNLLKPFVSSLLSVLKKILDYLSPVLLISTVVLFLLYSNQKEYVAKLENQIPALNSKVQALDKSLKKSEEICADLLAQRSKNAQKASQSVQKIDRLANPSISSETQHKEVSDILNSRIPDELLQDLDPDYIIK